MKFIACVFSSSLFPSLPSWQYILCLDCMANVTWAASLTVTDNKKWGYVLEEEPNAILVAGQARLIIHQLDLVPKAEEMLDEHGCDANQKAKYNAVFEAANEKFQVAVQTEMAEFMATPNIPSTEAGKESWKERILANPLLCDTINVKCKIFPQLAPEIRVEAHDQEEYDYILIPCDSKKIGHIDACPTTHSGQPGFCCGRDIEANYKRCPTESMIGAIKLANDWHNSNLGEVVPFGPTAWARGKFARNRAQYGPINKAKAYCFGFTEIFSPDGHEKIGDTLMKESPGFLDKNNRSSIRLHIGSAWHHQSVTIDVNGAESPKRRKRDLQPLLDQNIVGRSEWGPDYLEYDEYLNNTYVTVTSPTTHRTAPLTTISVNDPDRIKLYYDDIENPEFDGETLPLSPPHERVRLTHGGSLSPINNTTHGRNIMERFNDFWKETRSTKPSSTTSTTSTSTTSTSSTMKPTLKSVTELSKALTVIPEVRQIEAPKYAELPGQPRKSRAKSRMRRGWYGFLTKLGFLGLSPKYTDDSIADLKSIEDHKIEQLGQAIASNTKGLLKVTTLGSRIKTVRQDFCQSILEVQESSIAERLEMRLDETLQSMVTHMEICNSGVVPLSVPEANLIKLCSSVSDSPVCRSTSVRSLFSCRVDGMNFIEDKIVTGFDVSFRIPIADQYTLKMVIVLPLFSDSKRTIRIRTPKPQEEKKSVEEDPMELLGRALEAAQRKAKGRARRETDLQRVVNYKIHKLANKLYAVIETKELTYTYGFLDESNCSILPNKIVICDWLQATKLDACWRDLLNGREAAAIQTCKSQTEMTEKTCFSKQIRSGYVLSAKNPIEITLIQAQVRQNAVLQEQKATECSTFCILTLATQQKSAKCNGMTIQTDILSDMDIIHRPIAETDTQIDLRNLRPKEYDDAETGIAAIDNLIENYNIMKPANLKNNFKIMQIITSTISLVIALFVFGWLIKRFLKCPFRITPQLDLSNRDLGKARYPASYRYKKRTKK